MNTRLLVSTVAALLAALGPAGDATARPDAAPTLTVRSSAWGKIVFDGNGRALYAFTADRAGTSTCSGACAAAWPPYVVRGSLRAGAGTKIGLLGTIRRADRSRQVTYAGKPLYFYVGDRNPGQVLCQNVREF